MAWPNGTKVEHEFLGTYIIVGPQFKNDIGRIMVPVIAEHGTLTYFNPQNLRASGHTDGPRVEMLRTRGGAISPSLRESRGKGGLQENVSLFG